MVLEYSGDDEQTSRRNQSISSAARQQSGRLVSLGRRSPGMREKREQADTLIYRLLGVPLVPRHGSRILRRSRHG